jgi:hypothetical protein
MKVTAEGVDLAPCSFAMISSPVKRKYPTVLLAVPRSIPRTVMASCEVTGSFADRALGLLITAFAFKINENT